MAARSSLHIFYVVIIILLSIKREKLLKEMNVQTLSHLQITINLCRHCLIAIIQQIDSDKFIIFKRN